MENSFLGNVAEQILAKYGHDLRSICIVLPNKRAAQFLYKELAIRNNNNPIWAPKIKTSVQLLREYTSLISADRILLINELFKIHTEITERTEPLHKFFPWGEILLNDFNDIDKYRVPAKILYSTIAAEKEMGLDFSYLTEMQLEAIKRFWGQFAANEQKANADFIEIWQNLFPIYESFKNKLREKGIGFDGMIYRDAADSISKNWKAGLFKEYIIVGFNQLDSCERELFDTIISNENHTFYWDYDLHYASNPKHEAGLFARKFNKYHSLDKALDDLKHKQTNIHFLACATDAGQAQWMGKIMLENNLNPGNTGIILPKEEILPSLLNAIPAHYPKINITMGFPIYLSSIYPLAEALFNLKKNTKIGNSNTWYYFPWLKKILQNSYIQAIIPNEAKAKMEEWKLRMYINSKELNEHLALFSDTIFSEKGLENYYVDFLNLLVKLQENFENRLPLIDQQIIPIVYKELKRLHELVDSKEFSENPNDQLKIIQSTLRSLKVPFIGEPVEGLQIMGPLESRSLDFENVIIPNMNEGSFPGDGGENTYIPHSLRKTFGLPGPDEKIAAQSYFFYRLLHKAKNVYLLYNTESDGLSSGEKSRYLWQIENELSNFSIHNQTLSNRFVAHNDVDIRVEKTPIIMAELEKFTQEGGQKSISPTAFSSYLSCSLKFYFSKIARLREDEILEDEIDSKKFGNILHETLEILYQPYLGKQLQLADFKVIREQLNQVLDQAFEKVATENTGLKIDSENIIIKELIKEYALKVLNNDESRIPFKIIGTEWGKNREDAMFFHLKTSDQKYTVRFFGIVDRIDEKDGIIEIIDYKTGNVDLGIKSLDSIFSEEMSNRKKALLQTFLYEEMYKETIDPNADTIAKIYSLKETSNPLIHHKLKKGESKESVREIMLSNLNLSIDRLFNKEIAFTQTNNLDNCKYCEFRGICNRI